MENNSSTCCSSPKSKRCTLTIIIVLIIVAIAFVCGMVRRAYTTPDKNLFQVVLLTNDQAFFGKLHDSNGRAPYLTEVYYLKPGTPTADANGNMLNSGGNYNVIKRGAEIHSPTDKLVLNPKNILYWENVGADSLVAKGIAADKEYKATGKAPVGVPVAQPTAPVAPAATPALDTTAAATETPITAPVTPVVR